ncbi:unnamed protein product [Prorocentrum cordatum]|uniref:Glycerophosphocholine acyltransferase 1 n=1 Tax=Prorocentrum cordatum TaxID=2364126 RepID=A0ABN9Y8S8_9DINO|nr:unnamed protein product [Polarella glacialis]CAK0907940.1 unnamed protein product [Polarella glacialis]
MAGVQVAPGHSQLRRRHTERACPHLYRPDQGCHVREPAAQTIQMPQLFKEETEIIRVRREPFHMEWTTLLVPVFWAVASFSWESLYMRYFQRVLPDYKWDVKGPCYKFLTKALTAD